MTSIESVEVVVTSPGRNFVTLKIVTDEGVTGVGDGVDIDEEAAARHPYRRAHLPVNRLEDDTVHPW